MRKRKNKTAASAPTPDPSIPKLPLGLEQVVEWLNGVRQRWGWQWVLVIGPVIVGLTVWWNWKEISERPGIQGLVEWFDREPLPQADPRKFSIAVARLQGDTGQEVETLIFEALSEVAGGSIQILRFDRLIAVQGVDSDSLSRQGHDHARDLLETSHAHVLVWGTVLRSEQKSVPKLHWTVHKKLQGVSEFRRYPVTADDLDLPPIFREDLQNVLALLTLNEAAQYAAEQGHYLADRLQPFIGRVRGLIQRTESKLAWNRSQRAQLQVIMANALSTLGEQSGDVAALTEAVAAYRAALGEFTRERVPLDWAMTQNNLGTALRTLGERESGTARLEEAVAAYRAALSVFEAANIPPHIEMTRRNLRKATQILAARTAH